MINFIEVDGLTLHLTDRKTGERYEIQVDGCHVYEFTQSMSFGHRTRSPLGRMPKIVPEPWNDLLEITMKLRGRIKPEVRSSNDPKQIQAQPPEIIEPIKD
jgi:hypothetical protein